MFGDIKSIAELAVRDWCRSIGLDMHYIKLGMDGNEAMIEDVCQTCRYRNRCPERSRMMPCRSYKKRTPDGWSRPKSR